MTIFDKLFGKKSPAGSAEEKKLATGIEKSLFVEDREPEDLMQDVRGVGPAESTSVLGELLERDYFSMGRKIGYEDHRPEVMEEQLDLIASTFREAYYKEKAAILERMDCYELELSPKTKEVMPDQYARIEKKLAQEHRRLEDIQVQIDLAGCGEGYIEQSVRLFKAGFRKGYTLWLDEEIVFQGTKLL